MAEQEDQKRAEEYETCNRIFQSWTSGGTGVDVLRQFVAQQSAAKDATIAELRQGINSKMYRDGYGAGILEAAKLVEKERARWNGTSAQLALSSVLKDLESLASQHPQPTAGQEVEDAGTLRINTHEETSDERIRELRETPMTLECFATLERVLSERHALLVDAANRAIASERAAGKGGNDETR